MDPFERPQGRARAEEHHQDVRREPDGYQPGSPRVARGPYQQEHGSEQAPGDDVVHGRAGDRHRPHATAQEPLLRQDARQHGKRSHAHGRAEEQRERREAGAVRRGPVRQTERQSDTERERHRDARAAGGDRHPPLPAQLAGIQLEADQEHEQHQPDLAQQLQKTETLSREERGRQTGSHPAETRRSQKEAGRHLSDDLRLSEPGEDPSDQARQDEDDDDLDEQDRQARHAGRALTGSRSCRR